MNSVCSEIVSSLVTTGELPEIYKNKKVALPTLFPPTVGENALSHSVSTREEGFLKKVQ